MRILTYRSDRGPRAGLLVDGTVSTRGMPWAVTARACEICSRTTASVS